MKLLRILLSPIEGIAHEIQTIKLIRAMRRYGRGRRSSIVRV